MFHFSFLWWRIRHHGHWHCEKSMLVHSASLKRFSLRIFIQKHNASRRFGSDSNNLTDTGTGNENNTEIFTDRSIEVMKSESGFSVEKSDKLRQNRGGWHLWYRDCQFYWLRKLEYQEKTTDLSQVT